jgi:hypothetical protein
MWLPILFNIAVSLSRLADAKRELIEPVTIVLALPSRYYANDTETNPFLLSLELVAPVIQVSIEDVYYKYHLLPANSIRVVRMDTQLRDDIALVEVVRMATIENMHALIGMASTAVIERCARVSKLLPNERSGGTPMITTTGRSFNFDLKAQYPLLTRMLGSYNATGVCAHRLITEAPMLYRTNPAFLLHETFYFDRSSDYSECFWATLAVKKRYQQMGTPIPNDYHKLFDERRTSHMLQIEDYLRELSTKANCERT